MIQLLNHNMGRISTTLQDIRIRDTIYKVLRTGPGAHKHYHHYQSHAVKAKTQNTKSAKTINIHVINIQKAFF